jgi:hypothetical protein
VVVVGKLSLSWRREKELVSGVLDLQEHQLWDLTVVPSVVELEHQIAGLLRKHGAKQLDFAVLQGGNRELTQGISRFLFEQGKAGLLYRSRVDSKRCLALFEGRARVTPLGPVRRLDEDFHLLTLACSHLKIIPGYS